MKNGIRDKDKGCKLVLNIPFNVQHKYVARIVNLLCVWGIIAMLEGYYNLFEPLNNTLANIFYKFIEQKG